MPKDPDDETEHEHEHEQQVHQRQAEDQRQQPAAVIHQAVRMQGEEELRRPAVALAWSGLQTGLVITFSLVVSAALHARLADVPHADLIWNLGYPVGFLFVVIGRMQLFTENTLIALLPVLHARGGWKRLGILWSTVLATNLLGTMLAAWFFASGGVLDEQMAQSAMTLSLQALEHQGMDAFLKGIVGGWLIALMAWMLSASKHGRLPVVVIVTYVIAITDMTHVIAGSAETFYAVAAGAAGWLDYAGYVLPTLIGNTLGGTVLVTMVNHGQIRSDRHDG